MKFDVVSAVCCACVHDFTRIFNTGGENTESMGCSILERRYPVHGPVQYGCLHLEASRQ